MDQRIRGMTLVAGAALAWSTGGLLARLVHDTDIWPTIFWRSVSAFVFLLAFVAVTERRDFPRRFREMGIPGVAVGACFAASSILLVVALSYTSVAQTLVIMSATPLIAAIFGRVFFGEAVGITTALTIGAVMLGIGIMAGGSDTGQDLLIGGVFAGLMAASYAGAIVISRRYNTIGMAPAACLGAAMAAGVALFAASPLDVAPADLPVIALFGAGQLGLGMTLFVKGVRLIPATHAALIAMLETVLGPIWVWLALSETPPATVLIGGAIVLLSVGAKTLTDVRTRADIPAA